MPETKKKKVIQSLGDIPDHIASMEIETYDAMITCIRENLMPEDIFFHKQLKEWAEKNDYVKDMSDMEWDRD